jgi:heat shock protein HslJ
MTDIEDRLRSGLRQAVANQPRLGPIDTDEVIARGSAGAPLPARRAAPRWLAAAAALAVVAGLGVGLWFSAAPRTVPAAPATPAATGTTATLQLAGTTWAAIQIKGEAVVASAKGVPRLRFTSASEVIASDPCNSPRGRYVLSGGDPAGLTFSGWGAATDLGCQIEQQQRFTAALAATRTARAVPAHGNTAEEVLELSDEAGTVVLRFTPAEGSGTAQPTTAPTGAPSTTAGGPGTASTVPASAVMVRVRNDAGFDFATVEVQFPDGTQVDYGPLAAGAASVYAEAGTKVYGYARVRVTTAPGAPADGRTYTLMPADFVGERQLAPGQYTYALSIDGDQLVLTLE